MTDKKKQFNFKKLVIIISIVIAFVITNIATGLIVYYVTVDDSSMTLSEIETLYSDSVCSVTSGESVGTGFVAEIDTTKENDILYIVTNYHVIENYIVYDNIELGLEFENSGDSFLDSDITLSGYDEYHDIAVLCVEEKNEKISRNAIMSTLATVSAGDELMMFGNMLGQGMGVFDGIMSDIDKVLEFSNVDANMSYRPVYQVSIDINSGCSGGAIVNDMGQFVGVASYQIATDDVLRPVVGVSFCIPASIVYPIVKKAILANDSSEVNKVDFYYTSTSTLYLSELMMTVSDAENGFVVNGDTQSPSFASGYWAVDGDKIKSIDGVDVTNYSNIEMSALLLQYVNTAKDLSDNYSDYYSEIDTMEIEYENGSVTKFSQKYKLSL